MFVFQTTGHVFFYNEEKYRLIYCRNNKRTSITVLLSKVTRRAVDKVTRDGQAKQVRGPVTGLLHWHWHCCDTSVYILDGQWRIYLRKDSTYYA